MSHYLQWVFCSLFAEGTFPLLDVFGHSGYLICIVFIEESFREDLDLSGWRGEWVFFGVAPKIGKGDSRLCDRIRVDSDVGGFEFVQMRDPGESGFSVPFESPFDPIPFGAALCVSLTETQFFGDCGTDLIIALGFKGWINDLGHQDDLVPILPTVFQSIGLELSAGWQQKIRKTAGRS